MLILAYKHIEEEDEALALGNIPLDPDNGYSHQHVAGFGGYAESLIESVRFYCTSDRDEGRIMHFKTSHTVQIMRATTATRTHATNQTIKIPPTRATRASQETGLLVSYY